MEATLTTCFSTRVFVCHRYELDSFLGARLTVSANTFVGDSPVPRPLWTLPWTHPSFLAEVEAMLQYNI